MHFVRSPRRIAPDMPPRAARLDPRAYCSRNPPPSHLPATRCALARCAGDCTPLSLTTPAYSRSQVQPLPSRKPRDASAAAHSPTLVTREPNPTALPLCEQESDSAPALHTGLSGSLSLPIQHAHALDQRHSTYRSLISLSALAGKLARMCLRRLEAHRHAGHDIGFRPCIDCDTGAGKAAGGACGCCEVAWWHWAKCVQVQRNLQLRGRAY